MSGRARLGVTLAGLALAASACTVGGGSGIATGELQVLNCNSSNSLVVAQPFNLAPAFFAGEPIEDICPLPGPCNGVHVNRLVIRMQHIANRPIEVNDTLYFDVVDAVKTARCIRGATVNGQPTWDTRLVTGPDGAFIPGLPWCDWAARADPDGGAPATADGGTPGMTALYARINLSTQDYVRGYLAPLFTCGETHVTGVSMPGSWIDFQDFGSAAQPEIPADMRQPSGNDFKVEFGQRLRAHFHVVLGDQHVVDAIKNHDAIPESHIMGILDGWFDFDLERGRAAQPFP